MVDHLHLDSTMNQEEVGRGASLSIGPEFPPGFENFINGVGPLNQADKQGMPLDIEEVENSVVKENEIDHSTEESNGALLSSEEKVPQTPLLGSNSNRMFDDLEGAVPCEEDLVEARISWDIGKTLGCKVSDEKAMICALAKVSDCQDFVLPRKRGRPRKRRGRSKD